MSAQRPFQRSIDLIELQRRARSVGCELVTKEFLADIRRQQNRLSEAETRLRDLAALNLLAERQDWRGLLVRRWIAKTQAALDLFGASL